MKYYYGNSMKEALLCAPVTIKSTRILEQYKENYNVVISVDDIDNDCYDDEDEGVIKYIVTFDNDNENLYSEFDDEEDAFDYAKENVANKPCVTKGWQSDEDAEFGCGDDYKEVDITYHDSKLSEML